jgi:hypothetical protein
MCLAGARNPHVKLAREVDVRREPPAPGHQGQVLETGHLVSKDSRPVLLECWLGVRRHRRARISAAAAFTAAKMFL